MVMVQNAPRERLPPGCSCMLMTPGTSYEARVSDRASRVHNPGGHRRGRITKLHTVTRRRKDY